MIFRPRLATLALPLALTAGLALARAAAVPAISDPLGAPLPAGLRLDLPWMYILAAPLFTLWDGVSMLSMRRLEGFLAGVALLFVLFRIARGLARRRVTLRGELVALALGLVGLLAFIATGMLWHRPMAALRGAGADAAVVDFHTHTRASHDVGGTLMDGYDLRANLAWHARAGFDATFVTDHNTVTPVAGARGGAAACPGLEVSAWRAHVVLLGGTAPVDRTRYNRDLDGLLRLLRTSESAYGALTVASIPEYARNHWERLDTLVASGLDGFEVVNASPKANELTRAQRDRVIALARRTDRFVVGASDHHGWGATSMVWNLIRVPGWRHGAGRLCAGIQDRLQEGFGAIQIVERHRLRPDDWWPWLLTPLGVVWETWRAMGTGATGGWLLWIWGPWALRRRRAWPMPPGEAMIPAAPHPEP